MNEKIKKGIFHFHSDYSFDSNTKISKIADIIAEQKLDFVVLTDHNSLLGSLELKKEIIKRKLSVEVPIAVEYATECGDIIIVGPSIKIDFFDINDLITKAKKLDAAIILPHPYDYHKLGDWVEKVDCIEVFNGRSSIVNNEKALQLCNKYNKVKIYSSDAHVSKNICNVIISYSSKNNFLTTCKIGCFGLIESKYSSYYDIYFSQVIKSFKICSLKIFLSANFNLTIHFLKNYFPFFYNILRYLNEKRK